MATDVTTETAVLIAAHAASRDDAINSTTAAVTAAATAWVRAGGSDHAAITRWAKHAATQTRSGQRTATVSAAAYWARLLRLLTGRTQPSPRLIDPATIRGGVPLDVVLGRAADYTRWLYASQGPDTTPELRLDYARESWSRRRDWDTTALTDPPTIAPRELTREEITNRVLERIGVLTADSIAAAERDQIAAALKKAPNAVTGYRRVVRPELAKSGSCGLCLVASTRRYLREDLMPMHSNCNCIIVPIIGAEGGDGDPGAAINDEDLKQFYDNAGGNTAAKLRATKYRIVEHPELGPRLVAA